MLVFIAFGVVKRPWVLRCASEGLDAPKDAAHPEQNKLPQLSTKNAVGERSGKFRPEPNRVLILGWVSKLSKRIKNIFPFMFSNKFPEGPAILGKAPSVCP